MLDDVRGQAHGFELFAVHVAEYFDVFLFVFCLCEATVQELEGVEGGFLEPAKGGFVAT